MRLARRGARRRAGFRRVSGARTSKELPRWPLASLASAARAQAPDNETAPDLSAEGSKGKGIQFQIDHLKCPSCVNPGSPMPPFAALGEDNLKARATFLEASKGPQ